jgi:hypothetical protein
MPSNLLKVYNQLLELLYPSLHQNIQSIRKVFNRDFIDLLQIHLRTIPILPTTAEGEDTMDRLFRHLTTHITDERTRKREFETDRSVRIHWIRFHLEEKAPDKIIIFKVADENRVYVLDKAEKYVVVLEPLRNKNAYYLLTAYHLQPANFKKIMKKYEKRGEPLL